jgi:phosphohistidine phosphatase
MGGMRTIHLLRHAKSSWREPDLADPDRPLAPRGRRAAPLVAEHMRARDIAPRVVLCSSARRTRDTLALLGDAIPSGCEVRVEDDLYGASADALLVRLRALSNAADSALVIGHNPGLHELALLLARSGAHLDRLRRKLPTGALATLEAPIARWSDLEAHCATLTGFVRPRDLEHFDRWVPRPALLGGGVALAGQIE